MLARRPLLVAVLGAALLTAMIGTAGATSHRPAVTVSPGSGGPKGHYTVSFRAPAWAGRTATQQTTYIISASTKSRAGCQASVTHAITYARLGQIEHVRLAARSASAKLCKGIYRGSVMLIRMAVCGPPTMICPQATPIASKVGTFRFRVK